MRNHYSVPADRLSRSAFAVLVFFAVLLSSFVFSALPARAACEDWGAPSFYCPSAGGNRPVCGSSPNYYCPASVPTCNAYQQLDCASCTCVPKWDTPCSPPNSGFLNGSGVCACKPGTTLCTATNTCVTNLSCASGQVFDACSNSCVEKYILNSPPSAQTGSFNITGSATVGAFKLTATPSNGYIMTSDADGNASWTAPTSGLGGTGTLNYIAKFTPNGTTLGNSGLTDDGSKLTLTDEALLLTGTTGSTPASGAGTRLMWVPAKSAFRAGSATLTQFDDSNIGTYSFAVGQDTVAAGTHTNSLGWSNTISIDGGYSTAFGRSNAIASSAAAYYSFASGQSNSVNNNWATALGRSNSVTGTYALAAGFASTAGGSASRAMGYYASAAGSYATAMGYYASAAGSYATAMGYYPTASGSYSVSLGQSTTASADNSIAIGSNVSNATASSLAIGFGSTTPALTVSGSGATALMNTYGDITSTFVALNGSSTASAAGTNSTSLTLVSATNFDIGNYILVNSTYAKITNKVSNTLTISPALSWPSGAAVTEYHIPEIGGTNTVSTLTNRFGRGYFIDGIVMGNGTTYYTDKGIQSTESLFINTNVGVGVANATERLQVEGNARANQLCLGASGNCISSWLTVKEVDGSPSVANVTEIQFDSGTGLRVTDLTGGKVKVALGSGYKTVSLLADGGAASGGPLNATGEDTLKLTAGAGVVLAGTDGGAGLDNITITNDLSDGGTVSGRLDIVTADWPEILFQEIGNKTWRIGHDGNDFRIRVYQGSSIGYVDRIMATYDGDIKINENLRVTNYGQSLTLTDFTQGLVDAGINIVTNYTASAYTPGVFWSTGNNNSTKPKAGIWLREDGSGTDMFFGTSNSYATGITNNGLVIDQSGRVGVGDDTPSATLDVNGNASVGPAGSLRMTLGYAANDYYNPVTGAQDRDHYHFSWSGALSGKEPLIETSSDLWIIGSSHNLKVDGLIASSGGVASSGAISVDGQTVIDDGAGWHRTTGSTGWYNQTYGGGWYMTDTSAVKVYNGKNIYTSGQQILNNGSPTLYLQDNNHRSAMVHVNSNTFYVLRGDAVNSTTWEATGGYWPLTINLENNDAVFGRNLTVHGNLTIDGALRGPSAITRSGPYNADSTAYTNTGMSWNSAARTACFLTRVSVNDCDAGSEWCGCEIYVSGDRFYMKYIGNTDDEDAKCTGYCIEW